MEHYGLVHLPSRKLTKRPQVPATTYWRAAYHSVGHRCTEYIPIYSSFKPSLILVHNKHVHNHRDHDSLACRNRSKVPSMSVSGQSVGTGIPSVGVDSLNDLNVRRGHGHIVRACDPVLGAVVAVAGPFGRQPGYDIVGVCDAVVRTGSLGRHVLGELSVADAGTAVGVLFLKNRRRMH